MERVQKIEWLSVLQGWSMLLVVVGHITLTNTFNDPQYPIAMFVEKVIYSFHMPLFMFISGYLFYWTRIRKDIDYVGVIKEKLIRLGIPFVFFTLLTVLPKMLFSPLMKRPIPMDWHYLIDVFILFKTNPLGEMWFIVTLFILMLFYPMYKWMLKSNVTIVVGIIVLVFLNRFNPQNIDLFQLSNVMKMGIFFWCGILFAYFQLLKYVNKGLLLVAVIILVFSNWWNMPFMITNMVGILCSLSLSVTLAKFVPNMFSSFRDYTYQIFLMGIFFQMSVRYLFAYIHSDNWYLPCYLLSIMMGIYGPILIAKGIQKMNKKYLNLCFGLN
ncbi:MAG: acyltransferase family protein [Parabacteroides sp.]